MQTDSPADSPQPPASYVWVAERPSKEKIYEWAQNMFSELNGNFRWEDIPLVIKSCITFSADFPSLTLDEKRAIAIEMLNDLIDATDTPYLPDSFSDPLFKAISPLFVNLLITDTTHRWTLPHIDKLDIHSIPTTVQNILRSFNDGFQWTDLIEIVEVAIFFSNQYPKLSSKEKANISKEIINCVIDETDTPYLIDSISDPIFKAIIDPLIDIYFEMNLHSTM